MKNLDKANVLPILRKVFLSKGARKDLNELVEKNTGFKRKRKKYALYSEVSWRLVGD